MMFCDISYLNYLNSKTKRDFDDYHCSKTNRNRWIAKVNKFLSHTLRVLRGLECGQVRKKGPWLMGSTKCQSLLNIIKLQERISMKYEVRRICEKYKRTISNDVLSFLVVLGIKDPVLKTFCKKLNWTLKEKVSMVLR